MEKLMKSSRLKRVLKESDSAKKRLKALQSLLDNSSAEEQKALFRSHFKTIYRMLLGALDLGISSTVSRDEDCIAETCSIIGVLMHLVESIPEQMQTRWQARSIGNLIIQLLSFDNVHRLRLLGLNLLLRFIDTVGDKIDQGIRQALACACNFLPMCEQGMSENVIKFFENDTLQDSDAFTYGKRSIAQSGSETIELLECLLTFASSRTGRVSSLSFWLSLLSETVLPRLFDVGAQESLSDNPPVSSVSGFVPLCPQSIQVVLVQWLRTLVDVESSCAVVFGHEKFAPYLREICRQSFFLPATRASQIEQTISIYRHWIRGPCIPRFVEADPQLHIQRIFLHVFPVFNLESINESHDVFSHKLRVCTQVVKLIRLVSLEPVFTLSQETRGRLLLSLLKAASFVVCTKKSEEPLVLQHITHPLLDALMDCYVRCNVHSLSMQTSLHDKVQAWTNWVPFVEQWRSKLVSLTRSLLHLIQAEARRPPFPQVGSDSGVGESVSDVEAKFHVWYSFLRIFGDPNAIANEKSREIALQAVVDTLHLFLDFANTPEVQAQPTQVAERNVRSTSERSVRQLLPQGNTLLRIFGSWLFACSSGDAAGSFSTRSAALAALCRLFCSRTEEPLHTESVHDFFQLVHNIFSQERDQRLRDVVLCNCDLLFCVDLPAVNVLLAPFLRAIVPILTSKGEDATLVKHCVRILLSWMPLARRYHSLLIPVVDTKHPPPIQHFSELNSVILSCFRSQLQLSKAQRDDVGRRADGDDVRVQCLWGLCVFVFTELLHDIEAELVLECIVTTVGFCSWHEEPELACAAIEVLRVWSARAELLHELDPSLVQSILGSLTSNGMNQITLLCKRSSAPGLIRSHERIACLILSCLVEWAMVLPLSSLEHSRALPSILHLIDTGLHCPLTKSSNDADADVVFGQALRDACRITLVHLQNRLWNFPLPDGVDRVSSLVTEQNDPTSSDCSAARQRYLGSSPVAAEEEEEPAAVMHLVLGDARILSVLERFECSDAEPHGQPVCRVIVRDMSGKYCWDFRSLKHRETVRDESMESCFTEDIEEEVQVADEEQADEGEQLQPCLGQEFVSELLLELQNSEHSEAETERQLEMQHVADALAALQQELHENDHMARHPSLGRSNSSTPQSSSSPVALTRFDECRRLLYLSCCTPGRCSDRDVCHSSHLGFLCAMSSGADDVEGRMRPLDASPKLQRSLRLLDRNPSRECSKIALIYVADGQDHQRLVLRNEAGSTEFERFVDGIGWPIDVRSHAGFLGGLDPHVSSGVYAPYWASSTTELLFHVVSRMPTQWMCAQQIAKKRHVGNDHCSIVWSENGRDFLPSTISSHFNHVHIIIYPLKESRGLYRVSICTKATVPSFGPLLDGMVLCAKSLAPLVRLTALNANRAVRRASPAYTHPYLARLRYVQDIIDRHSGDSDSSELLQAFMEGVTTCSS